MENQLDKRPTAVKDVSTIVTFESVLFIGVALVLLTGSLLFRQAPGSNQSFAFGLITVVVGSLYAVLAYGFYNLRRWSYKMMSYLVRIDGLCLLVGLPQKVDHPDVKRAFGLKVD